MARLMPLAAAMIAIATIAVAPGTGTAQAQSFPGIGGSSGNNPLSNMTGGAASMLGGSLPNLSSASSGNVAGVLGYCAQNNLLQGANATTASSTLSNLTQKPGITSSSAYATGQQGLIQTGNGNTFSLADLKGQLKTKVCNMVLNKAQSFL
ncbi:hypothetical protein AA101099_2257 [Neoasaia chiangmaiensis NBRC 101099]|uniref:Uncharacterized protein n=1 Tax=Neoasaia chiangmaiensis TaxID=320497 RepID=A0A1U9KSI5_9PROT|nr:hypothetical protein A0U93_13635 [Neoasaia chiangmaiensis]GBR40753.1 hypothetical protein AA101099_2257 [Neoasaia chiangmaiensis NBRC 101099]GEN13754.1 hypothetical protein NCH01_01850 [Neoasaia chiangmaiensis]